MNAPRIIWRRACAVRINRPDAFEAIHAELFAARRNDRRNEEIAAQLADELDQAFQVELG